MKIYRRIVVTLFSAIFILGGIAHFVLGRTNPEGYSVFADTALIPALADLWRNFAMPNISWLTIVLGCYELAAGVGLILPRTRRFAAIAMLLFLVFITVVGYGFPTTTILDDILKNRLFTTVMAVLILPLLYGKKHDRTRHV
ncbi:hypothetical protein [Corynebacterium sp. H113]|uniref:hypothetical protein n=1 Tax=Corynebacterium sp. H113 TaxID=3133419 RepID=UPI0030A8C5E9